ncbi:hypothetical protein NHE_0783 [Neorickettsia helminthoeca str. Oregon]|uniref:Uncharacterized protein n=1 Tax=Neorickettsia helminthoeca str. Oregon TaxID=1286528 RepID=X5H556_9RICK|nr:hypothetical protein [Neorickettsia helminthoeca]AHX11711.1 hypothetical protein NHE_0783 [Neorickettsia helminthoeca str. Oregon]
MQTPKETTPTKNDSKKRTAPSTPSPATSSYEEQSTSSGSSTVLAPGEAPSTALTHWKKLMAQRAVDQAEQPIQGTSSSSAPGPSTADLSTSSRSTTVLAPKRRKLTPEEKRERNRERNRKCSAKYYSAHRDEILQRRRESRARDPERFCEYGAKYRAAHRDEIMQRQRESRARDPKRFREYEAKYRAAHRDEIIQRQRESRARDPEKFCEYGAKYRAAHRDEIIQRQRESRARDPEKFREYEAKYRAAHRDEIIQRQREQRAKKKAEQPIQGTSSSSAPGPSTADLSTSSGSTTVLAPKRRKLTPEEQRERNRISQAKYRAAHHDEIMQRQRESRARDPEKFREYRAKYYSAHHDEIIQRLREQRAKKKAEQPIQGTSSSSAPGPSGSPSSRLSDASTQGQQQRQTR